MSAQRDAGEGIPLPRSPTTLLYWLHFTWQEWRDMLNLLLDRRLSGLARPAHALSLRQTTTFSLHGRQPCGLAAYPCRSTLLLFSRRQPRFISSLRQKLSARLP